MRRLLFLLVLLPLCTAATLQPLQVAHTAADYTGTAHLQGPLAALIHYEDPRGATSEAAWTLTADVLHVERDEVTAPDTGPVVVQPRPTTTAGDYPNSTATGSPRTDGYSIAIMPLADAAAPSLAVSCSCINVTSEAHGIVTHDESVRNPNRDARTVEIGSALRLLPCQATAWTLHVRGDFLVVLWSWQTKVTDQDGDTHDWSSGEEPRSMTPPDAPPVEGEHRTQTYLVSRGATLHYTTPDPDSLEAYLTGIQGDVAGTLRLYDATTAGHAGTLTLTGNVTVSSQRDGDATRTRLAGDVATASIAGEAITLAATTTPGVGAGLRFAGLVALAAVFAVAPALAYFLVHLAMHVGHGSRRDPATGANPALERGEGLYHLGRHHRALWFLRIATRNDPYDAPAWELRGHAHHHLGHVRRAAHCYEAAHGIMREHNASPAIQAHLAFLVSRCKARARRAAEAESWLGIASRIDPKYLIEATREPDFRPVEKHPNFRALHGGEWTAT